MPVVRAIRATQFYLSLEDDLMRLFGGDRMDKISNMMVSAEMGDDMPMQHKVISKAVEGAQRKVENINFSMRKNVLEYDDVMNKQRQVIYAERNKILDGKDLSSMSTRSCPTPFAVASPSSARPTPAAPRPISRACTNGSSSSTGHLDAPEFEAKDAEALTGEVLAYVDASTTRRPSAWAKSSCATSTPRSCCASSIRVG